jgi:glycosyltransferase-like protein
MHARDGLRIALFTYSTQPRGGVLHALALAEALCDAGHEAVLYALDDTQRGFIRAPRCASVRVAVGPKQGDLLSYVRGRIAEYVATWDPATPPFDVYHAHDGISGNALATLVERGSIPSYVRTVHHLDDFEAAPLAALQDRAVRSAERCFVVSDLWRGRVAATYGIDATVVPNGVDVERFSPVSSRARAELRERLGYGDGPLFLSIGGIEARKNALATLEAFARVRERHPNARLVLAGGASVLDHSAYRRAFDARVAELGLRFGEDITVTGVLRDDEIVAMLRAAHAFVFPSLVEGFGLVLLEALACGTPVVTSAIAPFDEFLTSEDAQLVDPRDPEAIASAMLHSLEPGVAATTAMRGPALARRFAWSASARAHVAAYLAATDREVATYA